MKKIFFILPLFFDLSNLLAQPVPDLAAVYEVRDKEINIRWAASTVELFRAGVQYGYKVERFASGDSKNDSLVQFAKPWSATNIKWNTLKKNKNAGLVYNLLYKNIATLSKEKKEILFGLAMKTCDLYPEIAKACGLFISDSSLSANEIYAYKISLWNVPASMKYTPLILTIDTKVKTRLTSLTPVKAKFGDKCSYITIFTKGMEDYAGFQVERSADSVNYTIVSQAPLISVASNSTGNNEIIYRDSLPENNRTYYYRARGITFFGSLSDPSNTISGKGRPAFREYPHIDSTTIIGNKYVRLKFGMPAAFDAKQLKGYVILRGTEKKGKYLAITQGLLSREADHYTDEKPEIAAYYKICAINAYGDSSFSFSSYARLADDVPPLPPQELKGAIDTSGAVILQWKANTEPDLLGYRVFRCNTEKEQPVELTKTLFKEPKFSDRIELKTLTKSIYYTVRAVDKTYNNSAYSTFCSLKRPDKIAPAEPVFKKAACSDSSIQVMWIPSSSIDVTHYKLLRKVNGQIWSLVKEWQAKDSLRMYTDTAIVIGNIYEYRLEISDETKNMSSATSQPVSYFPSFARPIKNFTAKPDFEKRIIHLTWTYPETQVYSYSIYKAKDNEDLRLFKTIDVRENSFTDRELYPGNKYHYFIKATLKNGIESKISEMVEVNF